MVHRWAQQHPDTAQQITENSQALIQEHLSPERISCYAVQLFQFYAQLQRFKPELREDMEIVQGPAFPNVC